MKIVAIDQGTSSTRGFVLADDGTRSVVCTRKHAQHYPQSGWVEHDPEELLQHVIDCMEAAGSVDAISIDNQGESCLAWNAETGKAISPVIVWQDRRTEQTITKLKNQGAEAMTLARAGLPLDPYFSHQNWHGYWKITQKHNAFSNRKSLGWEPQMPFLLND